MSTTKAIQRCPRCGNENRGEDFSCAFCGKRLRIERIENFPLFKRYEEWISPAPWYRKLLWLFINPAKSFNDINHKRSKAPGSIILLFNSLLYGLFGLALISHFSITAISGQAASIFLIFPYYLSAFLAFFLFGLIFNFIFYSIVIWLFSKGANYAVGFSKRLEERFGEESGSEKKKYKQAEVSPFSIYKGGVLLQKQQSHKNKMLMCAFAPFLLINIIKIIIVLVAFPTVQIIVDPTAFDLNMYNQMFNTPASRTIWATLDIIDALTIAIWVPILMAIGIRELSNSSTFRVLISTFIVGTLIAIFFYFTRPTFIL